LNLTTKLYVGFAVFFAVITTISVIFVSMPAIQNPPKGPLMIGFGPSTEATLNKTELLIDVPDQTINVRVTFKFNQTSEKYFIYTLLPYTIEQARPYAIYEYSMYPLQSPNNVQDNWRIIGNFSGNFMNTSNGSSIVNATLELNSSFPFHFVQPDQKDELTLAVAIKVHESLVAISDEFGASQNAIFTFFGDVSGVWSDNMSAYIYPSSQLTLSEPFIVQLRLPPSSYFLNSQPAPSEYYVKQDQRWLMFSLDFLQGQYAQTLVCNFVNPTGQAYREIWIFLTGVFSAFLVTVLVEAVKSFYAERGNTKQTLLESPTPSPPGEPQQQRQTKGPKMSEKEILDLIQWIDKQKCKLFKRLDAFHGSAFLLIVMGIWLFLIETLLWSGSVSNVDKTVIVLAFVGVVIALFTLLAQFGKERIVEANFEKALKLKTDFNSNQKIFLKALIKIKAENPEFELEELYKKDNTLFTKEKLLQRLISD
jgi:hypothetical protein